MKPNDISQGGFIKRPWAQGGRLMVPLITLLRASTWKTFYSDGNHAIQELTNGTSGDVLTSNGAAAAPSWQTPSAGTTTVRAYATGDQSVTNSGVLTNDSALSLTLTAAKTYFIQAYLVFVSQAGGWKMDFGGGAATATNFSWNGSWATNGTFTIVQSGAITALTTTLSDASSTRNIEVFVSGSIEVNAGGTFILRHAQNAAGGGGTSETRKQGSWLMATLLS